MNLERIHPKLINYLLLLFVLFTVFPVKLNYSSIVIILAALLSLIKVFTSKEGRLVFSGLFFIISTPLFIYLLGFVNTSDIDEGLSFILKNLSFLAFPLIFGSFYEQINKKLLLNAFLLGLCIVNIYLIYLFIYYYNFGERFYMVVTKEIYHSTYLGMYNAFAFWICVWSYKKNNNNKLFLLFAFLFSCSAILTSSRIVFILILISLVLSVFIILKSRLKRLILSALIILMSTSALLFSPAINQKFSQLVEINKVGFDRNNYQSVSSRFGKIEAATKVLNDNLLFGTGTGDMMNSLVERYKEMKFTMGYKYRYNPHNQYLTNLVRNGIIGGGICLFTIFLLPFYISIRSKNMLLFTFCCTISIVSLTESILEVHKGITFYVFFITLLLSEEITTKYLSDGKN